MRIYIYVYRCPKIPLGIFLFFTRQLHSVVKRIKETAFFRKQINRKARHIIINWIDAQYGSIFLNNIVEIDEEKKKKGERETKGSQR
jgi:hypothetical protein